MSSIALPYEKQIRHLIIADTLSAAATYDAFAAAAVPNSVAAYSEDGTAVVYGKPFYFAYTNKQGVVRRSDIIRPETIEYTKQTAPVTKVGKANAFKIGTVTVGKVYNLSLKVHYGTSATIYHTLVASVKAVTGDTANTVAQKLATEMATQLANDIRFSTFKSGNDTVGTATIKKNKYFTVSVATDTLTITEKDWILDGFKTGLKEMDQLEWNAEVSDNFFDGGTGIATKTVTAGTPAKNAGYEVAAAEHYLQMHRQSFYSGEIETSIREELMADTSKTYHTVDLSYFAESLYDPQKSDKMLTIATSVLATANGVMTKITTAKTAAQPE